MSYALRLIFDFLFVNANLHEDCTKHVDNIASHI
ncbi:hypothetical protein T01_15039 [Trichinella spiralis]|uniref:Uncharacterized protein n=1 Tax=Trichinella spiralis TaxID=6334 RepID=A0A0V0YUQ2_TRISP|nr:hypothetical protein T01_15039 [Trichinella spiralis]